MLSVPPDVRLPTTSPSPWSILAVMATVSVSNFLYIESSSGVKFYLGSLIYYLLCVCVCGICGVQWIT